MIFHSTILPFLYPFKDFLRTYSPCDGYYTGRRHCSCHRRTFILVFPSVNHDPPLLTRYVAGCLRNRQGDGLCLAQAGVEGVILADLNLSGAELVAQESTKKKWAANSHFRATAVQADVSDEAAVNNMVDIAVKEFGRIDYCVHAAGVSQNKQRERQCSFMRTDIDKNYR